MKLIIRNYRTVKSADILIDAGKVTLVSARNGRGKTSVAQAAAAALTRQAVVMPGVLVKDSKLLVTRGEEQALITIGDGKPESTNTVSVSITAAKAKVYNEDSPGAPRASAICAGLISLADVDRKERLALMARYAPAAPTEAAITKQMTDDGFSEAAIAHMIKRLAETSWETLHASSASKGTEYKAAWEAVTREKFGTAKAAGWTPENYEPVTDEDVAAAQSVYDSVVGDQAVAVTEIDRYRAEIATAETVEVGMSRTLHAESVSILDVMTKEKQEIGVVDDGVPCPHCAQLVVGRLRHGSNEFDLFKAVGGLSTAEVKKKRLRIAELDGKIANEKIRMHSLAAKIEDGDRKLEAARVAREKLAEIDARNIDAGAMVQAKAALDVALLRRSDRQRVEEAAKIYGAWSRNQKIVDMLAPEGLRRKALAGALDTFNKALNEICEPTGWGPVTIDPDFQFTMKGEGYPHISASMQFRVRVIIQLACARIDGSDLVVIDAADILDSPGRNELFAGLSDAGATALVTMTYAKARLMPPLAANDMGRMYWIEEGDAQEVVQ